MRYSKSVKVPNPPKEEPQLEPTPKKKQTNITNSYIQQLKQIFSKPEQIATNVETLSNIFHKTNQHFLIELASKMGMEDYRMFLAQLVLSHKETDEHIVEKSKRSPWQFILVEGIVSYNVKSEVEEEEMMQVGLGYPGFLVFPQTFMSPRYASYTIICQTDCTFLALNEEVYNRYIKKIMIKQVDRLANFVNNISIFDGVGSLNVRKYLAYFIPKSYKYNEVIYTAGSEANQVFFVLKGQVQIYSNKGENQINVVSLGTGECFGLDRNGDGGDGDEGNVGLRNFNAKSKDADLILLVLNVHILRTIKSENTTVVQNCQNYLNKVEKLHSSLIHKNINVLNNKQQVCRKIARKKKKKVKLNQNSLAWWGLAQNVKMEHKYQMPSPHQPKRSQRQSNQEDEPKTTLMSHKINQLRKRILQNQQNEGQDQQSNQQNELPSPYQTIGNYVPKVKTRVKMLQARPKVIDLAQVVKKKLITYAKNMGSFCDRLNLQ